MSKYVDGKLKRWDKISKEDQADLLYDLLFGVTLLSNLTEAAAFITDLLTRGEVRLLSKRLGIAKLLLSDYTYQEINEALKVSHSTIAKVASWLSEKGEGFRKVLKQIHERRRLKNPRERSEWERFKKSQAASFWPEIALEKMEEASVRAENEKLKAAIADLESKDVINRRIDESYREGRKKK